MIAERPRFWIQLTPADNFPNAGRRLAMVLKDLLRQHNFKCLSVGEIHSDQAKDAEQAGPADPEQTERR
jgi:hypothetical protein